MRLQLDPEEELVGSSLFTRMKDPTTTRTAARLNTPRFQPILDLLFAAETEGCDATPRAQVNKRMTFQRPFPAKPHAKGEFQTHGDDGHEGDRNEVGPDNCDDQPERISGVAPRHGEKRIQEAAQARAATTTSSPPHRFLFPLCSPFAAVKQVTSEAFRGVFLDSRGPNTHGLDCQVVA